MYKYSLLLSIIIFITVVSYIHIIRGKLRNKTYINDLNNSEDKKQLLGNVGEYRVAFKLNSLITKDIGTVINNVMLQSKNFSTQIDHIVVGNNKKVLIIETKNYKGTITGQISDTYWTQEVNGIKYKFKNPVMQNNYHKNSIQQLFNWYHIKYYKIIHIVVFSNNSCELNVNSDFIVKLNDLDDLLAKFLKPTDDSSQEIVDLINRKNMSGSLVAREKHQQFIQTKLQRA